MISLQTNVTSLNAQNNLNTDNLAMSNTIQQLSSGYRINDSGDDPAGLAVANQLSATITELNQGVNNASTGIAQLQIVDGGLSNISSILNGMMTLATESASGTFTGSRTTLNQEYQSLVGEITRQASNINLNSGGSFNSALSVYIGGATDLANGSVSINLSGAQNAVDATSLGLSSSSVLGGGTSFGGSSATNLNDPNALFNVGSSSDYESFDISYVNASGSVASQTVQVDASTSGMSGTDFVNQLNNAISAAGITGISAQIGSDGTLQLTGGNLLSATTATSGTAPTALAATSGETLINSADYSSSGAFTDLATGDAESVTVTAGGTQYAISLDPTNADSATDAVSAINSALSGSGVYAVVNGGNIVLQSASAFTVSETSQSGTGSWYGTTVGAQTVTAPSPDTTATGNAELAITAINNAIQQLGLVQGLVGGGENLLQYATNLANSQITNNSTAESDIRDANVAADASQLTQSQVLEQTAVAAMAQANSSSQVVLKLLQQ